MGMGGLRAYSLSHSDKVNAGAKPAKCTEAANGHRRVLCVRSFVVQMSNFQPINEFSP